MQVRGIVECLWHLPVIIVSWGSVILPLNTYWRLIIELFLIIVLAGDNGVLGVGDSSS